MSYQFEQHFDDESLEQYALGSLEELRAEILEEHLLICEPCRAKLDTAERYVKAMAGAGLRLRQEPSGFDLFRYVPDWLNPRLIHLPMAGWAAAAVVVCGLVFVSAANLRHGGRELPALDITLEAQRGTAQVVSAHHPLHIHLDARGLDLGSAVHLSLVDAAGRNLEERSAKPATSVDFRTAHALEPGTYFVRILKPGSVDPAREFALDVR